ncbi:MAG: hypothetical protein ACLPV4_08030 [Solirubrobacteraceae bacterium]
MTLPAGLLANASINGGACLTMTSTTPAQAAAGVTLNVCSKGINESAALERRIRRRRTKAVLLTVAVRDANGKITDLTARISHLTG